jgi:hypothetical protein
MAGKITRVSVTYAADTADGVQHSLVGLTALRRAVRPERLAELLDDLALACEDVIAARSARDPATLAEHLRRTE